MWSLHAGPWALQVPGVPEDKIRIRVRDGQLTITCVLPAVHCCCSSLLAAAGSARAGRKPRCVACLVCPCLLMALRCQDKRYHRIESSSGFFTRSFSIPEG